MVQRSLLSNLNVGKNNIFRGSYSYIINDILTTANMLLLITEHCSVQ